MKRIAICLIVLGVTTLVAISYLSSQQPAQVGAADRAREADVAAIKKAGQSFLNAYLAGDAKALAAHWTEEGEYLADDGATLRGRAEIEKAYADLFAKRKAKVRAEIDMASIRFPSRDSAIEEGHFKVQADNEAPIAAKYTTLHVREGGKWLMAVVREWPGAGASLHDLEWLIGAWEAKRDDVVVRTTYDWWGNKAFIRGNITIKQKDRTIEGFQMICVDRANGQLRSWTFDRDGSFAEATWIRDDKKWIQESAGVLENGSILAATNILKWIDNDSFTFQSVERSLDGEEVAEIAPVRVTRIKGKQNASSDGQEGGK